MSTFYYNPNTRTRYIPGSSAQLEVDGRIYVSPNSETLEGLGFEEVTMESRPDDNFYIVQGPDTDGTYDSTPRDLDTIKEIQIAKQKQIAYSLLSSTDWYVIRELEAGTAIPAEISSYRNSVRTTQETNCSSISEAADIPTLEALVKNSAVVYPDSSDLTVTATNSEPHLLEFPALENEGI